MNGPLAIVEDEAEVRESVAAMVSAIGARRRLSAFFAVVDYSCKPVDAGSLLERVESLIARKAAS